MIIQPSTPPAHPLIRAIEQPALDAARKGQQSFQELPKNVQKAVEHNARELFDDAAQASINAHVAEQMATIRRSEAGSIPAVPVPKRPNSLLDTGFEGDHKMTPKERMLAFSAKMKELEKAPDGHLHHSFDATDADANSCKKMKGFVWTLFAARDKKGLLQNKRQPKEETAALKTAADDKKMKKELSKLKLMDQYFLLDIACSKQILPKRKNVQNDTYGKDVQNLLRSTLVENYQQAKQQQAEDLNLSIQCRELESYLKEQEKTCNTQEAREFYADILKKLDIK
jgi:hypothetical protein